MTIAGIERMYVMGDTACDNVNCQRSDQGDPTLSALSLSTCPSYLTLSLHYHIYTITLQCIVNTGILPSILPLPIWQVLPNIYISSSGFKVHDPIFKIR